MRIANSLAIVHHGISFVSTMRSGSTTVPMTFFDNKVVANVEVVKEVVREEEVDDVSFIRSVIGIFFEEEEEGAVAVADEVVAVDKEVVSRVP